MSVARVIKVGADPSTGDDFLDDEASNEDSLPEEYATIVYGVTTHRIAFGTRDLTVDNKIYTAIPSARGELELTGSSKQGDMTLTLPIDHAVVRRWLQIGVPPKKVTVTIWRRQTRSSVVQQIFSGVAESLSCDDESTEATLHIPEVAASMLMRVIPNITVGRNCPHTWGDVNCGVARDDFKITTTVLFVNGRDVRVDMGADHDGDWAELGELVHVDSGESMTIREQTDIGGGSTVATLSMQSPIAGLSIGDTVYVFAGCKRDIVTCSAKFANKQRFGGFPQLPTKNPFVMSGWVLEDL